MIVIKHAVSNTIWGIQDVISVGLNVLLVVTPIFRCCLISRKNVISILIVMNISARMLDASVSVQEIRHGHSTFEVVCDGTMIMDKAHAECYGYATKAYVIPPTVTLANCVMECEQATEHLGEALSSLVPTISIPVTPPRPTIPSPFKPLRPYY